MKPSKKGVTFALDKIRGDAMVPVLKCAICPPRKLIYSSRLEPQCQNRTII